MKRVLACAAVALAVALVAQQSQAQVLLAEFSEQSYPTNPQNDFDGFTFGDLSVSGALTVTEESLVFDVATDDDGSNGLFGGVGVDFGPFEEVLPGEFILLPIDFDPDVSWWEMRVRKLANNEATTVNTVYRDSDSVDHGDQEEYQFNFDLSSIPDDGEFHTITVPTNVVAFSQSSSGAPDEINNPGLNQIQIQTVFGSDLRTHIEVDYARIFTIPEPATLGMVALVGCAGLLRARRR